MEIAMMMKAMATELYPEHASWDDNVYWDETFKCMEDSDYSVFVDDELRGFFIVKDDHDPIFPTIKRYIGTKVYIAPSHRKGRLLRQFYDKLFEEFPDGDILGLTEINSEHIPVLNKRHEHIANVYKLKRR